MAKETWIQGQCQEVEACLRKNNSKKAYQLVKVCLFVLRLNVPVNNFLSCRDGQLVKDLTTEKQGKSTSIQDKSGKCLKEENEILNRWGLEIPWGQRKKGKDGKVFLQRHLRYNDDIQVKGMRWDEMMNDSVNSFWSRKVFLHLYFPEAHAYSRTVWVYPDFFW